MKSAKDMSAGAETTGPESPMTPFHEKLTSLFRASSSTVMIKSPCAEGAMKKMAISIAARCDWLANLEQVIFNFHVLNCERIESKNNGYLFQIQFVSGGIIIFLNEILWLHNE